MSGITWRLSFFIIIAAESFHPRWHTHSLACRSCQQHNIRNWIVGLRTFTSGSKNDSTLPKLILFRWEQGALVLMVVQTGLVSLHLSHYTTNLRKLTRTAKSKMCQIEAARRGKSMTNSVESSSIWVSDWMSEWVRERGRETERESKERGCGRGGERGGKEKSTDEIWCNFWHFKLL